MKRTLIVGFSYGNFVLTEIETGTTKSFSEDDYNIPVLQFPQELQSQFIEDFYGPDFDNSNVQFEFEDDAIDEMHFLLFSNRRNI